MLPARAEETDRPVGLELGADDFVAKWFSPRGGIPLTRPAAGRWRSPAQRPRRPIMRSLPAPDLFVRQVY